MGVPFTARKKFYTIETIETIHRWKWRKYIHLMDTNISPYNSKMTKIPCNKNLS